MSKYISTTIKKVWMNKILSGEKRIEYKGNTDYWQKRLDKFKDRSFKINPVFINFLCGRRSYKYCVNTIVKISGNIPKDIDGKKYYSYYEIHLGARIG